MVVETKPERKTPAQVAEDFQAQRKSEREAQDKKEAEAKVAATGPSPEKAKTEEKKDEKQEEKDNKDKEPKAKEDKTLDPSKPIEEAKTDEDDEKTKVQKRFDKLTGRLKDYEADKDRDRSEIERLRIQIADLNKSIEAKVKPKGEEEVKSKLQSLEKARITQYLEEDKSKSRSERREMTKDEIEDWMHEDMVEAQEWMLERKLRRNKERETDLDSLDSESAEKKADAKAADIIAKQKISQAKVAAKHPDLDIGARTKALLAEGKSQEEVTKIVLEENPKWKTIKEILSESKEASDKYLLSADGPELLAEEMERRLEKVARSKPGPKPKAEKVEETAEEKEDRIREEGAADERDRQAQLDAGKSSTRGGNNSKTVENEGYKKQLALFIKAGKTKEDLDRILARRAGIKGT